MDISIILIYLGAMLAFGWWGKRRAKNSSEYLVAGRRLGGVLYTSTMAAVVIGGASTVGGVGLGYKYGISGMWLVVSIACGVLLLSVLFASRIQRLKVYTVSGMLKLRYGIDATGASGIVMMAYTLMLTVTSTIAYATIFNVLFGFDRTLSVILGGLIVVAYSAMGGMWSITLTDVVQFVIKTIGIFFLLLPFTWAKAGGYDGIKERVGDAAFSLGTIGTGTIITFFVVYTLGLLIGQDIWQRVFTAKSPEVARWGGVAAGVYCLLYGVAGALIGLAASALIPDITAKDDVYADVALHVLPVGLSGIVLAAAVAAMMSTASGALIATATVARQDVLPLLAQMVGRKRPELDTGNPEHDVRGNRLFVIAIGLVSIVLAALINDIVSALTIAYDILVGGLLVPIIGGLFWKRATGAGAMAAMAVGTVGTLATMWYVGDVLANEPVYVGLIAALIAFVAVSLVTPRTPANIMAIWIARSSGKPEPESEAAPVPVAIA
ncbi:sodium:solute symporter [Antrihabitans stalactiti]|uniref:Sodium:solute symporter n=1 Tax=Antrihabitans stalactiti TaxID=2584121 RepID=A0A848KI71_9NOCA|nr:sodium:solute symporter [Antrihabitans stalactiti]NMN95577.1 sodium:solute symporter [Antrihabitans stalactiti]